ncbi:MULTISPECIES: preprotein translocase subunit YajC [Galbibacter]|uniref:Sec translocon accessory complex subunit YajC n=1 Tax=Galbibacter pacificus TaxID=2996052 RepID=A0ABT6FV53_9FLAO|nr:preprotein translocase subunit YajC [Galbibacter pacificus]MDG3583379.1 preprotein translocase subunit YajC [Galbibacter pacificus]MDG3587144.1 preprotein translocase subunit YajC [Galbibacter pacificus]
MEAINQFAPFILIFAVMYFFMIRPQIKKQKQEKKFAQELKRGDRIVTKSGLHGKVIDLNNDNTCVIETMAGKMKFERSALSLEMSQKLNAPVEKKK